MPMLLGLPAYYFIFFLVAMGGIYWIACNAFKNDDLITGLICLIFIPYTIYYGFKRFKQNKIPIALFFVGIAGCIVSLVAASTGTP